MRHPALAAYLLVVFVLSGFSCADAPPETPQEKVERVVASMNAALSSGDAPGFVGRVNPLDPDLIEEWRYWINEAGDDRVSRPAVRLSSITSVAPQEVTAALELRWHLDGERVTQRIDARFVPIGTPQGDWAFAGRVWVVDESAGGLRVLADEVCAEHASIVLERTGAMLDRARGTLGIDTTRPLTVKLYGSAGDLQRSIAPTYTHPVSGWSEPGQSVKIHVSPGTHPDRLIEVLAHELGHFVSFAHGEAIRSAPWWALEGAAELVSDPYKGVPVDKRQRAVGLLVSNNDAVAWDDLRSFDDETMSRALYVYTQGWSMVRYIHDTHGRDGLGDWFERLGEGETLDDATRGALSMGFRDLSAAWRAHVTTLASKDP